MERIFELKKAFKKLSINILQETIQNWKISAIWLEKYIQKTKSQITKIKYI